MEYPTVWSAASITDATSPTNTVRPSIDLTGVCKNSSTPEEMEFTGAIIFLSPIRTFPAGEGIEFLVIARVISSGLRPFAFILWGSILTTKLRILPPKGAGAVIPGMFTNMGLTFVMAIVCNSVTLCTSESKTN